MNIRVASDSVRLLRPDEVADQLGVQPATLATWRCTGSGPSFVKVGRNVRYAPADVDAFISERRRAPGYAA